MRFSTPNWLTPSPPTADDGGADAEVQKFTEVQGPPSQFEAKDVRISDRGESLRSQLAHTHSREERSNIVMASIKKCVRRCVLCSPARTAVPGGCIPRERASARDEVGHAARPPPLRAFRSLPCFAFILRRNAETAILGSVRHSHSGPLSHKVSPFGNQSGVQERGMVVKEILKKHENLPSG